MNGKKAKKLRRAAKKVGQGDRLLTRVAYKIIKGVVKAKQVQA